MEEEIDYEILLKTAKDFERMCNLFDIKYGKTYTACVLKTFVQRYNKIKLEEDQE